MAIESSILVGVVGGTIAGTIVWLGQEIVKFVLYECRKFGQSSEIKRALVDLHGRLNIKESRDYHQYNTLFESRSRLEGLVRYANAVDHGKKADIHSVIQQIESILKFYQRWHYGIPEHASETARVHLILGPDDLEFIQGEIESIEWLDIALNR